MEIDIIITKIEGKVSAGGYDKIIKIEQYPSPGGLLLNIVLLGADQLTFRQRSSCRVFVYKVLHWILEPWYKISR